MRNVKKILVRDIIALFKNPFALLIAGGLCILPALYAWFNIYSNWDPYGNTKQIQIAVASNDRGYTRLDGSYVNAADSVIDALKENDSIHWTVTKTADPAVDGVRAGRYYAAVVFSEDFTECMYQGFLENLKRPTVAYYENEKKNAVATKITDTAVSTLENNINKQYISLVVSAFFDKQRTVAGQMETAEIAETILAKIKRADQTIENFSTVVRSLVKANDKLAAAFDSAGGDLSTIRGNLDSVAAGAENVPDTQALADRLNAANSQAVQSVSDALSQLKQAQKTDIETQKNAYYQQLAAHLTNAKGSLDSLINSLESLNVSTVNISQGIVLTQLENQSQTLENLIGRVGGGFSSEDPAFLAETERQLEQQVKSVQQALQTSVSQSLALLGSGLQQAASEIAQVAGNIGADIDLLDLILDNGKTTVELTNQGFSSMAKELDFISGKLDRLTETIREIEQAQMVQSILHFMQGSADAYGTFFAQPVSMKTEIVYPVENYGSGVTPFYTTLALWVGGVVLVSLIKVNARTDGLKDPKPHELFFGRYLLFLILALIQAAITVWGNFSLLHIQCLYPRRFLLAAFLTSATFSLLIYALTISFGDIGKAVVVVLMVIQIAGSSGTYPIEILPQFYQKLYIFFPFPYAINAMREAVAGTYEHDFTLYLLRLLLFAAAALVLGLFIRLPFRKFSRFIERRMEDTGMM